MNQMHHVRYSDSSSNNAPQPLLIEASTAVSVAMTAAMERISPGWPESFVSEFFKIGTKYFEVSLETNEASEMNLEPVKPLSQVWPVRVGA